MNGDGDPVSYGCALAFIYYLTVQLGFTINEVIANYSSNLASCYHAVTGDSSDPFPGSLGILEHVFPAGTARDADGDQSRQSVPDRAGAVLRAEEHVRKDETQDIINHQGGLISSAFWVVIDGLSQQAFQNLGVQVAPFSGAFANLQGNGVQISANPGRAGVPERREPEVAAADPDPLRHHALARRSWPVPGLGRVAELDLSTSLTAGGATVSGSSATMDFELIAAGDPYFTNIDPAQNNQPYLSQDLRVFSAAPAINNTPVPRRPDLHD